MTAAQVCGEVHAVWDLSVLEEYYEDLMEPSVEPVLGDGEPVEAIMWLVRSEGNLRVLRDKFDWPAVEGQSGVSYRAEVARLQQRRASAFVYGSLLRGLHNHHLLQEAVLLGQATTVHAFGLVANGPKASFPYAFRLEDARRAAARLGERLRSLEPHPLVGEVYVVSGFELERLDLLEGYREGRRDCHYKRQLERVRLDGEEREVFVYLAADPRDLASFLLRRNVRHHAEVHGDWRGFKETEGDECLSCLAGLSQLWRSGVRALRSAAA